MKKVKILVPVGCRSDEGLSAPIIRRLKEQDWCECITIPLVAGDYLESFKSIYLGLALGTSHPHLPQVDLVLITGDRIEMEACAQACFLNHVKIAHFYAGIIDYSFVLFDDIHRHCITLMSDIAFCESKEAAETVIRLWRDIGKILVKPGFMVVPETFRDYNIHIVGISHLDDLEVDEALVPSEPYDLLLFNEITIGKEIRSFLQDKKIIMIGSNPDGKIPLEEKFQRFGLPNDYEYYENLPRAQFLGLLKRCNRFITNSSSAYYEAPHFLKPEQIILVGKRNKNRSTPKKLEVGASQKIVRILKEYFEVDKK